MFADAQDCFGKGTGLSDNFLPRFPNSLTQAVSRIFPQLLYACKSNTNCRGRTENGLRTHRIFNVESKLCITSLSPFRLWIPAFWNVFRRMKLLQRRVILSLDHTRRSLQTNAHHHMPALHGWHRPKTCFHVTSWAPSLELQTQTQ